MDFYDVNYQVFGSWCREEAVLVEFLVGNFRFGRCILGHKLWPVSSNFVLYSVHIFLPGPDIIDNATACDFRAFWDFVPEILKTSVSNLGVDYAL